MHSVSVWPRSLGGRALHTHHRQPSLGRNHVQARRPFLFAPASPPARRSATQSTSSPAKHIDRHGLCQVVPTQVRHQLIQPLPASQGVCGVRYGVQAAAQCTVQLCAFPGLLLCCIGWKGSAWRRTCCAAWSGHEGHQEAPAQQEEHARGPA